MKRVERAGIRATKGKGIGREEGKEEKEERIMGRERIKTRMARRRQGKGRTRSNPRKRRKGTRGYSAAVVTVYSEFCSVFLNFQQATKPLSHS
jgi:hypothetical protein